MLVGAIHESPLQPVLKVMKFRIEFGIQESGVKRKKPQGSRCES
jgi:hypothetical protein